MRGVWIGCREDEDRYTLEFLLVSVDSDGILSLSLVVEEGGVGGSVKPGDDKTIHFYFRNEEEANFKAGRLCLPVPGSSLIFNLEYTPLVTKRAGCFSTLCPHAFTVGFRVCKQKCNVHVIFQ